jgi:hypothetical protein
MSWLNRLSFARVLLLSAPLAALAVVEACLPGDTRPEPAEIRVTFTPDGQPSVVTADGWTVIFDRFLLSVGDVALSGDACNDYADTRYERLFDGVQGGSQKVSDVYGLGTCSVRFQLRTPGTDALLGVGVSEADLAAMREQLEDASGHMGRPAAIVQGHADKGSRHFTFTFAPRARLREHDCGGDAGAQLQLAGGNLLDRTIALSAAEILRGGLQDDAPLLFEPFASADINLDGHITLDELSTVMAPPDDLDAGTDAGIGALDGGSTVADRLYARALPRLLTFDGKRCTVDSNQRRPGGGGGL